jgi:hypothetical protein
VEGRLNKRTTNTKTTTQQVRQSYPRSRVEPSVCQLRDAATHKTRTTFPLSQTAIMADNEKDTEMKDAPPPTPKEASGAASGAATPKPREKPGRKPGVPQGPKKSVPKSKLKEEGMIGRLCASIH